MACRRAAGPRSWSSGGAIIRWIVAARSATFERTTMSFDFKDKRIVVAGGSRGIGRSIALGFAAAGAAVSICARNQAALAATRDELAGAGGTAHAAQCDLADG